MELRQRTVQVTRGNKAPFTLAATSSWNPIGLNGHVACLNKSDSIWMWLRSDSGWVWFGCQCKWGLSLVVF